MHRLILLTLLLLGTQAALADDGTDGFDAADVRQATAVFHSIPLALAAGYVKVPGLDYCFDNPGVGGMGYHYINVDLLGGSVLDPDRPEALVYTRHSDGNLYLSAVEYIVPAAPWDASHTSPPTLAGLALHLEPALGVYVLHAWVWKKNPAGMFFDWNPRVSCP